MKLESTRGSHYPMGPQLLAARRLRVFHTVEFLKQARVKAIGRFIGGYVTLRSEQVRPLLLIVLRRGMKRLICQSLYSTIGKDLALHGPRTIVTEESSDFVYCRYNEHHKQVEKTLNENY